MEQEPVPFIELIQLVLFLGSITFLLGTIYQVYILKRNNKPLLYGVLAIMMTRSLTIISSYFIWAFWRLPFDYMFFFLFLPAVLPEAIFSPMILKLFGNRLLPKKPRTKNQHL